MKQNVGSFDRLIRALLGVILLVAPFVAGWGTLATVISVIVGIVMLGVALTRVCLVYSILGIRTNSSERT